MTGERRVQGGALSRSRLLAASLVLITVLLVPHSVLARGNGAAVRTQIVTDGVRLTLSLPKRMYPRNALVRATVTVHNVSRREVYVVERGSADNGFQTPQVEVVGPDGNVVYPPALSMQFLPRPGQVGSTSILLPKQTIVWNEYVILRATRIRTWLDIQTSSAPDAPQRRVMTPPLMLHLVSGTAPRVTLRVTGSRVVAVLHPMWRAHGPLVYMDSGTCVYPGLGTQYPEHFTWIPALRHRFTLQAEPALGPCPDVLAWRAIAGWNGQPVAQINYLQAGNQ